MRKALVVGINHYMNGSCLYGCVDDAHSVKSVLERNSDGTVNFAVKLLSGTGPTDVVLRSDLKDHVRELFAGDSETALFYFAGHGHIEATGGYLLASDCKTGDDGVPLNEVPAASRSQHEKCDFLAPTSQAARQRAFQVQTPAAKFGAPNRDTPTVQHGAHSSHTEPESSSCKRKKPLDRRRRNH